jgi:hypothetical protein
MTVVFALTSRSGGNPVMLATFKTPGVAAS